MGAPQLNIKDAETAAMVRELAELTGESKTEAVRKAVKERLARARTEHGTQRRLRTREQQKQFDRAWSEIKAVQDEVRRSGLTENMLADDDLYDDDGLPR